jgi:hypothetical protein
MMLKGEYFDLLRIYEGSDGEATRGLYSRLEALGPIGEIAVNLFRAQKCSSRAKVYRGGIRGQGSYRRMAYDRKQWSIENLCRVLTEHAEGVGIQWGWREDPAEAVHRYVLFVELPPGQVSFHTAPRGSGPDYPKEWDGMRGLAPTRICLWISQILAGARPETEAA